MSGIITEKEYNVHYYEVDYNGKALISSIMNYFGDIAMVQTEELNIGMEFLNKHHIAWVLYKWDISINRYPKYNERVKVKTWAYGIKKFYAYRKFTITDSSGEVIVEANSIWFLIDIEKRKAISVPDYMYDIFKMDKEEKRTLKIDKISKLNKIDLENKFSVRYGDIDTNRHVNNVKYVAWAIETVPRDVVTKYELKNVKVTYQKETSYGNIVKARTQILEEEDGIVCLHKIQDKSDNELAILQTMWK